MSKHLVTVKDLDSERQDGVYELDASEEVLGFVDGLLGMFVHSGKNRIVTWTKENILLCEWEIFENQVYIKEI